MIEKLPNTEVKRKQGAPFYVVRGINRHLILNLIRTHLLISRAELARVSGLHPSTISLIVEQLIAEHWVLEGPTSSLPRGRRPMFLRLNDGRVIVAVDIRQTQCTVALADANGHVLSQEVLAASLDFTVTLQVIVQSIQRLIRSIYKTKVEGIGISLPGRYDHQSDRLVFAPSLQGRGVDLGSAIASATGLEVTVESAANACVMAAVWFDHSNSCRNFVVVTISEGIGAGIWANGQLIRGQRGMAGEFGHVQLDPAGPLCSCGARGCWEVFASNRAALGYYMASGSESSQFTFQDLLSRAEQGDRHAAKALDAMAHYVGRGMRIIVASLAPERIVVVGDLTRSWTRLGPVIESEVRAQVLPGGCMPSLIPAFDDGLARLRGSVALVLQRDFGAFKR